MTEEWMYTGVDPDSKVHGANMGPTWVLPAPDGPHIGPMNFCYQGIYSTPLSYGVQGDTS